MRFRPALTICFFLATLTASAQSTEADLSARLIGKPLFLRGFWGDDKLRFDAAGAPQGHPATASFTVAGVRVDKVQLSGNTLRLEGVRECLLFEDGVMERATLTSGKEKKPEELKIEVKGQTGQDFAPALGAIFADSLVELIPTLPPFWQRYAKANFSKQQEEEDDDPDSPKDPDASPVARNIRERGTTHVGGNVKAPRLIHSEDPKLTDYARRMKYSGKVEVYLWAEEDGSVSHVSIAKPAGLGLDEAAVAAVMKYRFHPATRNDVPVKVDLYVDVNFQIF